MTQKLPASKRWKVLNLSNFFGYIIKTCINSRSSTAWPEQLKLLVTEKIATTTISLGENHILLSDLYLALNQKERNSDTAFCETVAKKYDLLCWMEQRGASPNDMGADSCTEMHLAGRETSSLVKFFGKLPENIEGHHLHPGLSGQLFSVLNFMFLYAVDHTLSCLSSRNKQLSPVTTLSQRLLDTYRELLNSQKWVCCGTVLCVSWEEVRQKKLLPRWNVVLCPRCFHDAKAPGLLHSVLGCRVA